MPINWQLGLIDSGRNAMDIMTAFDTGRKAAMEQNAIRTRETARQRASGQLSTGDTQGAQQTAIAAGDFDFAKAIGSYTDDQRKQLDAEADTLGRFAVGIKSVPVEQRRQAFAQGVKALRGRFSPEEIRQRYGELEENGWSDAALDGYVNQAISVKDALAAAKGPEPTALQRNYEYLNSIGRGDAAESYLGKETTPMQLVTVTNPDGSQDIVPVAKGGGLASGGGGGGPLSVDSVLPHIVAQESGGNYAARNRSTGALGAYQVMPATGKTLAGRLGLPWRPELMASDSPEARAYQDQIGRAAVTEAVEASGGDPATMAAYYHGGSDRSKWGPKTRQYAAEVTARIGGGAPAAAGRMQVKPPKATYRIATADEKRAAGVDPTKPYQISPEGQMTAIGGGEGASAARKDEAGLRKEFNQQDEVKEFKDTRSAFYKVRGAAIKQNPTAQDDISLIFAYMKMLDPTSVVREGEFATAQNATSVPDAVRNMWNKAQSGQRLNPDQRRNMLRAAEDIYRQTRSRYNEKAREFRGYATDFGVNPDRIGKEYNDAPRRPQQRQAGNKPGKQVTATIRRIS